jgi:hypothetical protein
MSEPDEGVDLPVDLEKYNALVAEDQAAWKAFSESDLGQWFKDEFRKGMEGSAS